MELSPFTFSEIGVISLCTLLLATLLLPVGYAALNVLGVNFSEGPYKVFGCFAAGTSVTVVLWTWTYMLGGSSTTMQSVLAVLTIGSICHVLIRLWRARGSIGKSLHWAPLQAVIPLVLLAVVAVFFLVPRTVEGEISQRQLMGPDSIGYSNAVSAILSRGSFFELEAAALEAADVQNSEDLLAKRQVYQIAEKGLSVSAEFIVGAYRVGFTSLVATITGLLGLQNLLSVMYVTVAFCIALGVFLTFGFVKSLGFSSVVACMVALLSVLNINLLVGFHEGGVAQGFMYPSLVAFLVASLDSRLTSQNRALLYSFSLIAAISSYIDLFFVYVILMTLWYLIALIRSDLVSLERLKTARRATLWSLGLMLPLTLRLPSFVMRRLADARQGGWGWDSWTELTALLGVDNPYSSSPDSLLIQIGLVAIGVMVFAAMRKAVLTPTIRGVRSFLWAFVLLGVGFYIYSRHLMGHSTYQWFKLSGTVIGPSIAILLVLSVASVVFSSRSAMLLFRRSVLGVAVVATLTSMSYIREYFTNAKRLDPELIDAVLRPQSQLLIEKYALVGTFGWEELALTPFWNAEFLNAYDNDPRVNPIVKTSRPIAFILRSDRCGDFGCSSAPTTSRFEIESFYTLIDLNLSSGDLKSDDQEGRLRKVNEALQGIGMRELENNWNDFRDRESDES